MQPRSVVLVGIRYGLRCVTGLVLVDMRGAVVLLWIIAYRSELGARSPVRAAAADRPIRCAAQLVGLPCWRWAVPVPAVSISVSTAIRYQCNRTKLANARIS